MNTLGARYNCLITEDAVLPKDRLAGAHTLGRKESVDLTLLVEMLLEGLHSAFVRHFESVEEPSAPLLKVDFHFVA